MLVSKALQYAKDVHALQLRKYTDEPYIEHPIRVAGLVMRLPQVDDKVIAAALLHDVVEDCDVLIQDLESFFGSIVTEYVYELTNRYTTDFAPRLNRKERKRLECERLSYISAMAKCIKLCDRLDNLVDLGLAQPSFRDVYIAESYLLVEAIGDAHPPTADRITKKLDDLVFYTKEE
jgi:(p)ppGpp synthase/HD superfamily hydrolase